MNDEILLLDAQLLQSLKDSIAFVKKLAAEGEKTIQPLAQILVLEPDLSISMAAVQMPAIPSDPELKQGLFRSLGRQIQQQMDGLIVAITFHCEAWAVLSSLDQLDERPSTHPGRVETILFSAMSFDGRAVATMFDLRRRADQTLLLVPLREFAPEIIAPSSSRNGTITDAPLLRAFFMGVASALLEIA